METPTQAAPAAQEPKFVQGERLYNYQLQTWFLVARTPRQGSESVALERNGYQQYRPKAEFFPTWRRQDRRGRNGSEPVLDAEQREKLLLRHVIKGTPEDPRLPTHAEVTGPKIKHYVVTYLETNGQVGVERVAAKGIVTAISVFYVLKPGTAVISVVCIL